MKAPQPRSKYRQLTSEQRYIFYALTSSRASRKTMSTALQVSESTISRELKRNSVNGRCYPDAAQRLKCLRQKIKAPPKRLTEAMKEVIIGLLEQDWSPEQITGRLRKDGLPIVSHELIYQHIWEDKKRGGKLYEHLRHKLRRNGKRGSRHGRRAKDNRGTIPNQVSIDQRPAIVETNTEFGHVEIDTVIGKNHKGVLVTIVERKTKATWMQCIQSKRADLVTEALVSMLTALNLPIRSITSDNGKEFEKHEDIAERLNTKFYFAHPYSSWERGLNENTNGLIRQYFPKPLTLQNRPYQQIQNALDKLNNRPRKILGYKTPLELLTLEHNKIALTT